MKSIDVYPEIVTVSNIASENLITLSFSLNADVTLKSDELIAANLSPEVAKSIYDSLGEFIASKSAE